MKEKEFICTVCPNGCMLTVSEDGGEIKVSGNTCSKGITYGKQEYTEPARTVTSVARIINGDVPVVSVRTSREVPKQQVKNVLDLIAYNTFYAPVKEGEVLLKGIYADVDLVATASASKKSFARGKNGR